MGGLWASIRDIGRWIVGFTDAFPARDDPERGHPLRRSSRREMQQVQTPLPPEVSWTSTNIAPTVLSAGYGMGLFISDDLSFGRVVGHGGGYPGFGSHMRWHPASGIGVVVLANSRYAPVQGLAKEALRESDVIVSTVIGFPHGSNLTAIKVAEAQLAMDQGARELDMVLNIGQLRSGKYDFVREDIQAVCEAAHARGARVKVIFENSYLSDEQKVIACKLSEAAGADWVKTSTGFSAGGATLDDLRLMRANVSERVQVKAAGGVRTLPALLAVIDAGATRCGATATATILEDFKRMKQGAILDAPKLDSANNPY
jgi:deoxyribose-phosphate aldolase